MFRIFRTYVAARSAVQTRAVLFLPVCCALSCAGGVARTPRNTPAFEPPSVTPRASIAPDSAVRFGPLAPKRPLTEEHFGAVVADDYRWLEDGSSPEVRAWSDEESKLSRTYLEAMDERPAVRKRFAQILSSASADYGTLRVVGQRTFALKATPPKEQPALVTLGTALELLGDRTQERVVVDPTVLDPSGKSTIDFFVPSPDGKIVAVSISRDGTERGDLHLFDVATGKERPEVISHVHGGTAGGSVAWNADGSGFYYTRYPREGERPSADLDFYQQVWFHKLGSSGDDAYVLGKDFPRIAEVELARSDDGKSLLASIANGDGGEFEHHVRRSDGTWKRLTKFEDGVTVAAFGADGRVFAVSRRGAPRGKVIAFAPPFEGPSETVVPEGDAVIDRAYATQSALYVVETASGPSRIRRIPLGAKPEALARQTSPPKSARPGKPKAQAPRPAAAPVVIPAGQRGVASAELPLPPVSSVSSIERVGEDLFVRSESFVDAPAWHRYVAAQHRLLPTRLAMKLAYDVADVEVVRETCTSKDGTRVPMSILKKRDMRLDGTAKALLTGYGGFGVSLKPRAKPWHRVWLDHGGVVAEANLRGGGELGEAWHRAGMGVHKQNVFDDFAACAAALVERRYTRPDRLAAYGRSNGGLLIGAAVVQHPELFRAAVAQVGIFDILRFELSPNGAFTLTEYGSAKDEAQFRALFAYSPLHNVRDGARYPSVLFTTGENDPRVDPYNSRKMVARMRAATASSHPILLRTSKGGHGMGAPLSEQIEELTDVFAFLLHEVGAGS